MRSSRLFYHSNGFITFFTITSRSGVGRAGGRTSRVSLQFSCLGNNVRPTYLASLSSDEMRSKSSTTGVTKSAVKREGGRVGGCLHSGESQRKKKIRGSSSATMRALAGLRESRRFTSCFLEHYVPMRVDLSSLSLSNLSAPKMVTTIDSTFQIDERTL